MTADDESIDRDDAKPECVNVDFPEWVINKFEEKARFAGVSSQDLIKLWVVERLDRIKML